MPSAEQWLARAVDRALASGDPARYPELVGAVEALAGTAAISPQLAAATRQRLEDAFLPSPIAPRSAPGDWQAPVVAAVPEPMVSAPPRAALSPMCTLGVVDEVTVLVMTVEAWPEAVIVGLAAVGKLPPRREPDHAAPGELVWWGASGPRQSAPEPPLLPLLLRLRLVLHDDQQTRYAATSAHASSELPWRGEHRFEPGAPPEARQLKVTATLPDGADARVALRLPPAGSR